MGSCQIIKNQINLDIIEIIQFCLKIHTSLNIINSIANGCSNGGIPGNSHMMLLISYTHVCAFTHTPSTHQPTPKGVTPQITKNSISLELIKIQVGYA